MLSIAFEMTTSAAQIFPLLLISFLITRCEFKSHCWSIQPSVQKSQVITWCQPWPDSFIRSLGEVLISLNPQTFFLMKYSSLGITHQLSNTKLLISIAKTFLTFRTLLALKRMLRRGRAYQKWRSKTSAHLQGNGDWLTSSFSYNWSFRDGKTT